ncbi:MAG: hypothetical protein RLY71_1392 [Pseudomonadota bacterium]|jgi:hypothetical protein
MPHIPLEFPFDFQSDIEDSYFEFGVANNLEKATWTSLNLSVFHKNTGYIPDIANFANHTKNLKFHGTCGFSLGTYHEFLIEDIEDLCELNFGFTEVTFGEPSPLITYLFRGNFNKSIHGEWCHLKSIRVFECSQEFIELIVLISMDKYKKIYNVTPKIFDVFEYVWLDSRDNDNTQTYKVSSTVVGDIEPLRCIYHARQNNNTALACIQYYRVLEYYASILTSQKINLLRFDIKVSDKTFLNQVQVLGRDEKNALIRLIDSLENSSIISYAMKKALIKTPTNGELGAKIYEFRNSIVHAKDDHKSPIHVDSIFIESNNVILWHFILKELAELSMNKYSTKIEIK